MKEHVVFHAGFRLMSDRSIRLFSLDWYAICSKL
jgi:hypothetical protein